MPLLAQLRKNIACGVHCRDAILAGAVRFEELVEIYMVFSCPVIVGEDDVVGELAFLMLIRRLEHDLIVGVLRVGVLFEVIFNNWFNLEVGGYCCVCVFESHALALSPYGMIAFPAAILSGKWHMGAWKPCKFLFRSLCPLNCGGKMTFPLHIMRISV